MEFSVKPGSNNLANNLEELQVPFLQKSKKLLRIEKKIVWMSSRIDRMFLLRQKSSIF